MRSVATEGMQLPTALASLAGQSGEDLAALIVSFHDDATTHAGMVRAGRRFIRGRHDQAVVAEALKPVAAGQTDIRKCG